ncbi:MAG: hypothetical protein LIO85_08755 [Rikenellaceae bacterium]|nr:hypothetical protein [Rikenellaceae bacterium]
MVFPIIQIIAGLFLWRIAPGMVKHGTKKKKQQTRFWLNIAGIILLLLGVVNIVRYLLLLFGS